MLLGVRMFVHHPLISWLAFTWAAAVGLALARECIDAVRGEEAMAISSLGRLEPDTSFGIYITGFGAALALAGAAASIL